MGKFDGVLIATDIDGTLTNSSFELSIENKTAIDYFKAEGGIFTIATGRLCDYLKEKEFDALVNCPVIVLNGAAVYDFETKQFLNTKKFQKDFLKIYKRILEFKDFVKVDFCFIDHSADAKDLDVENVTDLCKMVTVVENEEKALRLRKMLVDEFGADYEVFRTWSTGVEVLPKGATKGNCVDFLRNTLKNIKTVVGIGDFENDMSLLEKGDIAFAPENALEMLKQKADYIVSHHNDNALCDVIKILEKENSEA